MIVVAAATPWESRPLARALGLRLERRDPASRRWSGRGGRLLLVETGMGPERAAAAMDLRMPEAPSLVLSAGFAGSLSAELRPRDLVTDLSMAPAAMRAGAPRIAAAMRLRLHDGPLASSGRVLSSPGEKRLFGEETGAKAVDMESGALKAWAAARGCSFAAVRIVLDGVDERLPGSVPPEGAGGAGLLRYAASRWRELPLLARLGLRGRRAMAELGEFLLRLLMEVQDEPKA